MRPIHLAKLDDGTQPVLVLTREWIRPRLTKVTVAPIRNILGTSTEVLVGPRNGLDRDSAVRCDEVDSIDADKLGRQLGYLLPEQELELAEAIGIAFDLE